jgi:hypothetical protein
MASSDSIEDTSIGTQDRNKARFSGFQSDSDKDTQVARFSSLPSRLRTDRRSRFLGTQRITDSDVALVNPLVTGLFSADDSEFRTALASLSTAIQSGI